MKIRENLGEFFGKKSITTKLTLIGMSTASLSLILVVIASYINEASVIKSTIGQNLIALADIVGSNASAALVFRDHDAVIEYLTALNLKKGIVLACTYDREGKVFSQFPGESERLKCPESKTREGYLIAQEGISVLRPILLHGRTIGAVYILSDLNDLKKLLQRNAAFLALIMLGAGGVTLLFARRVQNVISRPLLTLTKTAKLVSEKQDYSIRATATSNDEIASLIRSFNHMLDQIEVRDLNLRKALDETKRALSLRDEFLAIASHELKTPITSLSLQAQFLKAGTRPELKRAPTPDQLARFVDISLIQINRLVKLIDEMLDISRIRHKGFNISCETINLAALVRDVVEKLNPNILAAKSKIKVDVDEKLTPCWDKSRIEQLLVNLVANAIKYAPGATIQVIAYGGLSTTTLVVKDDGPGISKKLQTTIFDRFERGSPTRNIAGLGLGLYICKKIAEAHGGSIRIESEVGSGSTFIVELPTLVSPK